MLPAHQVFVKVFFSYCAAIFALTICECSIEMICRLMQTCFSGWEDTVVAATHRAHGRMFMKTSITHWKFPEVG